MYVCTWRELALGRLVAEDRDMLKQLCFASPVPPHSSALTDASGGSQPRDVAAASLADVVFNKLGRGIATIASSQRDVCIVARPEPEGSVSSAQGGPSSSSSSSLLLPPATWEVFAYDRYCYHVGYPMDEGDIEDMASVSRRPVRAGGPPAVGAKRGAGTLPQRTSASSIHGGTSSTSTGQPPDVPPLGDAPVAEWWTHVAVKPARLHNTPFATSGRKEGVGCGPDGGSGETSKTPPLATMLTVVQCPLHNRIFDLRTGDMVALNTVPGSEVKGGGGGASGSSSLRPPSTVGSGDPLAVTTPSTVECVAGSVGCYQRIHPVTIEELSVPTAPPSSGPTSSSCSGDGSSRNVTAAAVSTVIVISIRDTARHSNAILVSEADLRCGGELRKAEGRDQSSNKGRRSPTAAAAPLYGVAPNMALPSDRENALATSGRRHGESQEQHTPLLQRNRDGFSSDSRGGSSEPVVSEGLGQRAIYRQRTT